jgi:poly(A) polymerase
MTTDDPNRDFATEVVQRLQDAGYRALWAGGCVRDFLLGREPKDYDVATSATPDDVRNLFGHRRTLAVGASFGVIIVRGPKQAEDVEVATFRTEGPYLDGRRPEHVTFATAEEDAQRRDFTINGMFYDPLAASVFDYVGGEADLSRGVVRAIGDPHDRVREDKLRMLRAVRFTATLDFELDDVTAAAVREMAAEIHLVSVERIAHELKRMLIDPHRTRAVRLARDVGLLAEILPELQQAFGTADDDLPPVGDRTIHMLQLLQEPAFELVMATLCHSLESGDAVRTLCRRLKLSNHEIDHIGWLIDHEHALDDAASLPLCRLKQLFANQNAADLIALSRMRTLAANADLSSVIFCEEYLRQTPPEVINPPPLLTGDDLVSQGMQPGPHFKQLLDSIRDAQLNEEIATPEQAATILTQLLRNDTNAKQEP